MRRGGMGTLVRLTVTIGLLTALVFIIADPREVGTLIANIALLPLIGAILLSLADRFLMTYKWWLLLRSRELVVSLWIAFRAYLASSLYGLVLPVTVGADAVRILALRHLGMMEVTASIVIERGLGVIAMGAVGLVSCLLLAGTVGEIEVGRVTFILVATIATMTILFIASLYLADYWATEGQPTKSPKHPRLAKIVEAYGRYRHQPGLLSGFFLLSVAESLLCALIAYIAAIGLGLSVPLHILIATVPLALASARLPISLGGFGVQEGAFVFLAGLVGVSSTNALSIMLVSDIAMLIALLPSAFDNSMVTLKRQAENSV